jgi:hypothetical protein
MAMPTAIVMPQLLKVPVGKCRLPLRNNQRSPVLRPRRGTGKNGNFLSPSVTGS